MNFDMIAYILLEFSKNFLLFPHLKKECHTHWMKPISKNFLLFSLSSNLGKRKSQMPFNQKTFTFYLQVFRFRGQVYYNRMKTAFAKRTDDASARSVNGATPANSQELGRCVCGTAALPDHTCLHRRPRCIEAGASRMMCTYMRNVFNGTLLEWCALICEVYLMGRF